jgi:hypothetical protein
MLGWLHTADHKGGASPVQEAEGAPAAGDRTGILRFPVGEQEAPIALRFVHPRRGIFLRCRTCFILACLLSGGDDRPVLLRARAASTFAAVGGLTSLTAHRQSLRMSDEVSQACPQTGARDGLERRSALPVPRLTPPQRCPPPPPAQSPSRPESPREDRGGAAADSPCVPTLPASHPAP